MAESAFRPPSALPFRRRFVYIGAVIVFVLGANSYSMFGLGDGKSRTAKIRAGKFNDMLVHQKLCEKRIMDGASPLTGKKSGCNVLIPPAKDICRFNQEYQKNHYSAPENSTEYCRKTNRPFSSHDRGADPALCGADESTVAVHCDTRLDVTYVPFSWTKRGFEKAEPDDIKNMGERPSTKRLEYEELSQLPKCRTTNNPKQGEQECRILCLPAKFQAVQLTCRQKNLLWHLIPDVVAEMRLPPSIFTLTRYGEPVGWLEYVCNLPNGEFLYGCFDDFNIVIPPKFGHVFEKYSNRAGGGRDSPVGSGPNAKRKYNVIAMQFDSLSRFQGISEMPMFQTFFRDRSFNRSQRSGRDHAWAAYDFANHNAYSDDTFPNLFAAFAGVPIYKISHSRNTAAEDLEPGPWWHWAGKNKRFATFYSTMSVLQGLSYGTDYQNDFSTVQRAADVVLRESLSLNGGYYGYQAYSSGHSFHCLGGKPGPSHGLEYLHEFAKAARSARTPFVAQMENEDMHNSNLLNARMVDEPLTTFLRNLERDGGGADTIVIINADHGARYGGSQNSETLRHMYNTNPIFRVLVPKAVADDYGDVLADNQRVVTHSLDIYATLRHLVEGGEANLRYNTDSKMWSPFEGNAVEGKSIFERLNPNRVCAEARIPVSRCTCHLGAKKILYSVSTKAQLPEMYEEIVERLKVLSEKQLAVMGGNGKVPGCKVPHLGQMKSLELQEPPPNAIGKDAEGNYTFQMWFSVKEEPESQFKSTIIVQRDKEKRFSAPMSLVGKQTGGTTAGLGGGKGSFVIGMDRVTPMPKSCKAAIKAASTPELRTLDHLYCLC
jgi:hypothetical protein